MQKFIFSDGEKEIELKFVKSVIGLGIPPVNNAARPKGWRQDGATVQWSSYQERPFTLGFDVRGANYMAAVAERMAVIRFFADSTPKTFRYSRRGFAVILYPVYLAGPSESNMHEVGVIDNLMQFVAANPWFQKSIPSVSAALEIPVFEYPPEGLEWPEEGNEYSIADKSMIVKNQGHVMADTTIRFVGPAENPYIQNTKTGQKIEVERSLGENEVLEINSETGRVDIVDSGGVRHNAFNYITDESEFVRLAPGENHIEYGSAGGAGYIEIGGTEYYAGI